ncbi:hypothetical protein FB565_004023 [Actinoplanes lutulentus]|uniref:Uncharacterized protein DUF4407 n=1 Tax=Actinoplanes lutulentus TaxID=1287878 RepID=A0A327ZIE0_9ACTN|nr:DUF4407 domain-containing protein [Actinoplanes lutulentus]MBB2944294.1 hypothetical protein [Actinoplanes lutulentus]RAK42473.1 uncharacterized protein DUF4407 [Actinoplanes lutulentus]
MTSPFIWLSGADPDLLAACPHGERVKYVGLGGAVLTTSVMSAVSCGFALHMAMDLPIALCVVLAIAWGMAIMNLDRWLISGTQRHATLKQNLLLAAPRVLLGVLIGLVVSTPLTLRIFQDEINAELKVMQRESQDAFAKLLTTDARFTQIPALSGSVQKLQAELDRGPDVSGDPTVQQAQAAYDKVNLAYTKARALVICEDDGTCGTGRPGEGKSYRLKVEDRDRLEAERTEMKAELDEAEVTAQSTRATSLQQMQADLNVTRSKLNEANAAKKAAQGEFSAAEDENNGLLARMNALGRLGDKDLTMGLAHLVLILFLAAFEVLPVVFKILLGAGVPSVYDRLRDRKDEICHDLAVDEMAGDQDLTTYERNARLAAERASVDAYVQEVTDVQREVAQSVMRHWRNQQLQAAYQNPSQFMVPAGDDDDTLVLPPGSINQYVPNQHSPNGQTLPNTP